MQAVVWSRNLRSIARYTARHCSLAPSFGTHPESELNPRLWSERSSMTQPGLLRFFGGLFRSPAPHRNTASIRFILRCLIHRELLHPATRRPASNRSKGSIRKGLFIPGITPGPAAGGVGA
jgi:hypothetical protein